MTWSPRKPFRFDAIKRQLRTAFLGLIMGLFDRKLLSHNVLIVAGEISGVRLFNFMLGKKKSDDFHKSLEAGLDLRLCIIIGITRILNALINIRIIYEHFMANGSIFSKKLSARSEYFLCP